MIKHLDGRVELKDGSKEDRLAAREWISLFWHEAVVGELQGGTARMPIHIEGNPTNPPVPLRP